MHQSPVVQQARPSVALAAPTGIGWLLWGIAAAVPWLTTVMAAPWTTAYQELVMAGVMLAISVWVVARNRGSFQLDLLAVGFLAVAGVPLVQAWGGIFSIPSESVLVSLYLVGFAVVLVMARHAEQLAPDRLIDALFTSLAIAGLGSTGVALCQWMGIDAYETFVLPCAWTVRPIGNIGQWNNLATLLVWGLVSVWWGLQRRQIGGAVAFAAAAFMLVGVVLSQSRTGLLEVVMLGGAACFWRRQLQTARHSLGWMALFVWFALLTLALQPLSQWLIDAPTREILDAASPRERTTILHLNFESIRTYPWFGVGWNQNIVAHVALADQFPMHGTVGNAHNLFLDLLIWNGIPVGLLLIGGLSLWYWRSLRHVDSWEDALLMVGITALAIHSMLELPYMFTYFLFPAAVMAGTLSARRRVRPVIEVGRPVVALVVLLMGLIGLSIFREYGEVVTASVQARMREANIAGVPPESELKVFVLRALRDSTTALRTKPAPNMSANDLTRLRRAATRYPTPSGLFRYAEAAAMNGQKEEAARALRVVCQLRSAEICRATRDGWQQLIKEGHQELQGVRLPDEPPRS